jgi:hypothetical protein
VPVCACASPFCACWRACGSMALCCSVSAPQSCCGWMRGEGVCADLMRPAELAHRVGAEHRAQQREDLSRAAPAVGCWQGPASCLCAVMLVLHIVDLTLPCLLCVPASPAARRCRRFSSRGGRWARSSGKIARQTKRCKAGATRLRRSPARAASTAACACMPHLAPRMVLLEARSRHSDETSSVTRHRVDWSYLVVQETLQICWAVSQEVAHRAGLWPSRDQDSASQRQVGAGDTMGALFERVRNSLGARAD